MEILNDFVMPTTTRGASASSKYATKEQLAAIHGMAIGQAVILPFLADVLAQRQRTATNWVVNRNPLHTKGNQRYAVAVVPDKGIAIKRIADEVIAEAAKPAEIAAPVVEAK